MKFCFVLLGLLSFSWLGCGPPIHYGYTPGKLTVHKARVHVQSTGRTRKIPEDSTINIILISRIK